MTFTSTISSHCHRFYICWCLTLHFTFLFPLISCTVGFKGAVNSLLFTVGLTSGWLTQECRTLVCLLVFNKYSKLKTHQDPHRTAYYHWLSHNSLNYSEQVYIITAVIITGYHIIHCTILNKCSQAKSQHAYHYI